jgi:uncharacterized Zn-binding protein involved in type VI secretion
MGQPAAKKDDQVKATDIHIVMVPAGPAQVPTPLPHTFSGKITGGLASTVKIAGAAAATVGSTVENKPAHTAAPPGTSFQSPPSDKGTIKMGSATVKIAGQAAARDGDTVMTCNDPADAPVGKVKASGSVSIGG